MAPVVQQHIQQQYLKSQGDEEIAPKEDEDVGLSTFEEEEEEELDDVPHQVNSVINEGTTATDNVPSSLKMVEVNRFPHLFM